jgi:hypothetical protein
MNHSRSGVFGAVIACQSPQVDALPGRTVMKIMIRIGLLLTLLVLLTTPAVAGESLPGKINVSKLDQAEAAAGFGASTVLAAEDRQLAMQKADFLKFAAIKIREMNSNHILSRARMQIDKRPDGLYRAFFHEIDDQSMTCQVSRSQSRSAPYVAVLSYKEQVFAASCTTPETCRQGQFNSVEEIPNRHIFVYNNGSWQ